MSSPETPARLPAHLAEKILQSRSELEGERRTVTVLFADAVGSTPLAERLDEEDVYLILQGAVELMVEAVHRYEGTVTHFLGDGIMALFGAPIAHEDAARRAVAAALDMQDALEAYLGEVAERHGVELRFRVGLNTGRVVVGRISDQLGMEYTAIGDTTNLAARMEQLAEPGSVYVSESTHWAARDYFEFKDLGELDVKGKAAAVPAYKVLHERGVRTRFEAASEHGLTPFVGRERELGLLRSFLEEAGRGEGQVVFVYGEAGIGKSRLLLEFRRSTAPDEVSWREGRCVSFGRVLPYLPIMELVKESFGIEEADDEARIVERVMRRTAEWDEAARKTLPYLRFLLNVDPGDPDVERMDPRERRAGLFEGLRALLVMESRARPLVAVVEDLHWMDEQSAEALAALVDVVGSLPVLLVLTHRPGYTPPLPDRSYYSRLALRRLPERETLAVAAAVLEAEELPPDLRQLIVDKGEGNPFYVEEVTRCLVEAGVVQPSDGELVVQHATEDLRLPDTIEEIILSRIDLLDYEARHAIQQAAVIGREFTARLLKRVSDLKAQLDEALAELKSLELVYEKQFFPELAYTFKHALTHDVAYGTLLRERRRQLHRLVGDAIEELYADRLGEHFETLAHHYYEGQQWDKALDYLVKAGDKTSAAYATLQARDLYSKALEVCQQLGETALPTVVSVAEKRARLGHLVGDLTAAVADFDLSWDAAERLADRRLAGRALAWRGLIEPYAYDFERGEATLRAALALGEEEVFDDVRLLASMGLGKLLQATRHEEADRYLRLAGELAERVPDPAARAWWSVFGGFRPNWTGRFDDAIAHAERWRGAGDASGNATMELG
ncbi:MAG: AAA family ATPase, partial [Actinomycetota bacterium]|nr:AAA family ATPase [Actinomycetota bacterium]